PAVVLDASMNCPSCNASVPEAAKFCSECGAPLPRACPACGHGNPASAKFCSECGAQLAPPSSLLSPATREGLAGGQPRFASAKDYTPKHLAQKILTSRAVLERAQAGDGAVRGLERLDGADRRTRSGGGARHPRAGARAHDGGGASLRGDREPGDGRRHHGPVRRASCP